MTRRFMQAGRKLTALFIGAILCMLTVAEPPVANAWSQAQDSDTTKARVRELHGKRSEAQIKLADGTRVQGQILRVEADSFTIREKKTGQEVTVQFAQVTEVKKKGLSRGAKAVLIPAIIGGGTLLLLCAAPYPIGFLCRKDPS